MNLNLYPKFRKEILTEKDVETLDLYRKRCSGNAILATTLAKSGHPGGSLSTIPLLLAIYAGADIDPKQPRKPERDRVIVSHGHTSPGTYSVLAEVGYFEVEKMLLQFRAANSKYAGHVEIEVDGVEWGTGNLGQGLSVGTASALSCKLSGYSNKTFVLMGDGEQQKGQHGEARRFAVKEKLSNLIALIDYNKLQIGGDIEKIMPQNIAENYKADGWNVIEVDGKDIKALYEAIAKVYHNKVENPEHPTLLLASTVMGFGVSFMENLHKYHGQPLSVDQAKDAMKELGLDEDVDLWVEKRAHFPVEPFTHMKHPHPDIEPGSPRLYTKDDKIDNRSAYGNALADLGDKNNTKEKKILGLTCDLTGSVKMGAFSKISPQCFFDCGIQEHHAAAVAGRLGAENFSTFFSTFGVFAVAETYNQLRLNTLNKSNVKVVSTHIGLNVGEDGPTHQSIDYIGLVSSLFNIRLAIPADPNQTDRVIRKIATLDGADFVGVGREKAPILLDENGNVFFDEKYEYVPGKADILRKGERGTLIAIGPMVPVCMQAHEILKKNDIETTVISMTSVIPLDKKAVLDAAQNGPIVTVEDHNTQTGLGSLVANVLAENGVAIPFKKMGVTHYASSGKAGELYKSQGLTGENVAKVFQGLL